MTSVAESTVRQRVDSLLELAKKQREERSRFDPFASAFQPTAVLPPNEQETTRLLHSFIRPAVRLPPGFFVYRANTDDFGMVIRELFFTSQPKQPHILNIRWIVEDLKRVAADLKISLIFTKNYFFPRDHLLRLQGGRILIPGLGFSEADVQHIDTAHAKSFSRAACAEELPSSQVFNLSLMDYVALPSEMKKVAGRETAEKFPSANFNVLQLDGGNVLTLTNQKGQRIVLIGHYHRSQIHAQGRLAKWFENTPPPAYTKPLSEEECKKVAEEMYSMGLLRSNGQSGFLPLDELLDALHTFSSLKTKESFREMLASQKKVPPLAWSQDRCRQAEPIVRQYLAQREALPGYLSQLFKIPAENIHFITQVANAHLDLFIKSGPKGSLFLQDFSYCRDIAKAMLDHFTPLGLQEAELPMLARYIDTASLLEEKMGPSLQQTRAELEALGFTVIPTPGLFYDHHFYPDVPSYMFNFFNAISGWSPDKKRYFYIAAGVEVGQRLGRLFSEVFTHFLHQYEPHLDVHFLGKDPEGKFSEGRGLWNQVFQKGKWSPPLGAGIHCMSVETKTEDHTENPEEKR